MYAHMQFCVCVYVRVRVARVFLHSYLCPSDSHRGVNNAAILSAATSFA